MEISFCRYPSANKVVATNFAHDTAVVLSWHVQKYIAIRWPVMQIQHSNTNSLLDLYYGGKIISEMDLSTIKPLW